MLSPSSISRAYHKTNKICCNSLLDLVNIIKVVTSKEELEPVKLKFHFKLIFFKKCISYHFIKEFEREFYMTLLLSRQKILQG